MNSLDFYLKKYDEIFKINAQTAKYYCLKINNNMKKPKGNLGDDIYYLKLLLENITEANYKTVYYKLIKDINKTEFLINYLFESLLNGQIINYKVKLIEIIEETESDLVKKVVNKYLEKIENESNDNMIQNLSIILLNIFIENFLDILFEKNKFNTLCNIFLNTTNEQQKDYIIKKKELIEDNDILLLINK